MFHLIVAHWHVRPKAICAIIDQAGGFSRPANATCGLEMALARGQANHQGGAVVVAPGGVGAAHQFLGGFLG